MGPVQHLNCIIGKWCCWKGLKMPLEWWVLSACLSQPVGSEKFPHLGGELCPKAHHPHFPGDVEKL